VRGALPAVLRTGRAEAESDGLRKARAHHSVRLLKSTLVDGAKTACPSKFTPLTNSEKGHTFTHRSLPSERHDQRRIIPGCNIFEHILYLPFHLFCTQQDRI